MADSCQAGAGSESKAGCSGGSAGTIYVQFWVANRVLKHHENPPCLCPCTLECYLKHVNVVTLPCKFDKSICTLHFACLCCRCCSHIHGDAIMIMLVNMYVG